LQLLGKWIRSLAKTWKIWLMMDDLACQVTAKCQQQTKQGIEQAINNH